ARLVSGNDALGAPDAAGHRAAWLGGRPVIVQVAAAHARRLDLEHHVARARRGVGEVAQLELSVTEKHHAFHASLLIRSPLRGARSDTRRWVSEYRETPPTPLTERHDRPAR